MFDAACKVYEELIETFNMRIVLSGVETNNKGAELMFYAILQEIERSFPEAEVYIPYSKAVGNLCALQTSLKLKYTPFSRLPCIGIIGSILRRLHFPSDWLYLIKVIRKANLFLEASGFAVSDQFNISDSRVSMWRTILEYLKKSNCKIVFLPQAFGPCEKENTRLLLKEISKNASLIMPREEVSFSYLNKSNIVDMKKVRIYPDFTSLVEGVFPLKYEHLRNGICIIPNMRMIDKGHITIQHYVELLSSIIIKVRKNSMCPIYILNHEGKDDEKLALQCRKAVGCSIEVVTGLNALEVKGLIGSSYLTVTSRFHGLASALNSGVPCLATSWSHKYSELYKDYGVEDGVLNLDDINEAVQTVISYLKPNNNFAIRQQLEKKRLHIRNTVQDMWRDVWENV